MLALPALLLLMTPQDQPGPGISRALAESRLASIRDVSYDLAFDLTQAGDRVPGSAVITFTLASAQDLVLDFGGRELEFEDCAFRAADDHVVLPGRPAGKQSLRARFVARKAPADAPLITYHDKERNEDFVYTLLVPSEAHRLFPCFDQPSLRGRFRLELKLPQGWRSVGNVAEGWTQPLPTYLFAFAAGPFVQHGSADGAGFARAAQAKRLQDSPLLAMQVRARRWLEEYFAEPYAFGKLDAVLLPAFPFGGMEHAGAIFYRESAIVFDHEPTASEVHSRCALVYHEVAHQWFGNLVTMRWFDDLWLKEGFATFLAYKMIEALEPERASWLRFQQIVKPPALAVDATPGTTPIWQELANLDAAKSNYGPIVYNKAPAVLRELEQRIGPDVFRDGVRAFVKAHRLGCATWDQLVAALAKASGQDLGTWSRRWILDAGVPTVRPRWSLREDRVAEFALTQSGPAPWPLRLGVHWITATSAKEVGPFALDELSLAVPELAGQPAPLAILVNPAETAYAIVLPDPTSTRWLLEHGHELADPQHRSTAIAQLYEAVRAAELDPAAFARVVTRVLAKEPDTETHAWLLRLLAPALTRWLTGERRATAVQEVTELLLAQHAHGQPDRRLQTYRFLAHNCPGPRVQELLARAVAGKLDLGLEDRYLALAALIAQRGLEDDLRQVASIGQGDEARRHRYVALAADPDPVAKAAYFSGYLRAGDQPEQWIQDSLRFFNWPGQEERSAEFLRRALENAEMQKQMRRIFFMPAWLDAFVATQVSGDALAVVDEFLAEHAGLAPDVRRKLLQSRDALQRTLRIRMRYP